MLQVEGEASTRDLLRLPALLVIVLVEVQMGTGAASLLYPLLAASLLSPFAQKLWAAILVARVLIMSAAGWPPLDQLVSSDFFVVRTVFMWVMLAQNRLLATNRPVQLLSRVLSSHTGALRKLLIATVVAPYCCG